jgi:two-component system response regulator NreC
MPETTRIVLADDHAVLRAGLRLLLGREPDLAVVGEAGTGDEAVRVCELVRPDVLVLDVTMPGNAKLAVLRAVRERLPATRVLLLTMHADHTLLREALRLGAAGWLLKKSAEADLLAAIRAVARGEAYIDPAMTVPLIETYVSPTRERGAGARGAAPDDLTPREFEVLTLAARGYANKEIAAALSISVKTVETHRTHINEKLGLRSRVDLIRYARRHGLLDETV